jgi:hypothetical protein
MWRHHLPASVAFCDVETTGLGIMKNPRTVCCCQPVIFMISAMVAPCGWVSRAITAACLEPGPSIL